MKSTFKNLKLLLVLLFFSATANAQVTLPPFFNCNMVLQQGIPIPVWGWASPGEKVSVTFNNKTVTTKTGKDGKWKVSLPSMNYGGPYKMVVKGKNLRTIENILIGEVWVCSGQSNMEFKLSSANNADAEIAASNYPEIRLFTVKRRMAQTPQENLEEGEWWECSPVSTPNFSAVAYFFGRELYKKLKVPIGLIHTSWGGTAAETWTSPEAIAKNPDFAPMLEKLKTIDLKEYAKNTDKSVPKLGPNTFPTLLYNGMIHPLIPYGIKGVIWYQGENNAGRAFQYRQVFPEMIKDWRSQWHQGDFPFLFVQLANYMKADSLPAQSTWAELREAQSMTLSLPKTGMASAIDVGDAGNIHPKDKQTVGKRLALSALKVAYNQNIENMGPVYNEMKVSGNKVEITFSHVGTGLKAKDKYGYVKGFALAGNDHKFHWATAAITGTNTIILSAPEVAEPVAVRYAWGNNPDDVNLYNSEGLPADPFRTDKWKGITE
ncbi:MAG: sialate O-acetylesterase [Bacteroidetes bacterium]|nr:sialate O-acetylesterase [Bacteroidota bacterium]